MTRLRIATFNLESLDDEPGLDPPLAARIAILRPQLLRLEADILCLQEVNGQRPPGGGPRALLALDRLLEGTPYAGFARASTLSSGGAQHGVADVHNLVLLSRFPIASHRQLRHELVAPPRYLSATAEPKPAAAQPIEWNRPLLLATLTLPSGRALHLLNLHLRAPLAAPIAGQKESSFVWKSSAAWAEGYFLATLQRSGQALEARLAVEALFDREPEALVAVCGDFNAEAQETPLRTLLAEVEDTANGRLAGRSLVPLERSLPETRRFSVIHHGRAALLDHILVSRALLGFYRNMEIHNETLGDELAGFEKVRHGPESYHAPLVAEFALPE